MEESFKLQKKIMVLRVASAYKTVSGKALQVITATPYIDILVRERCYMYEHRKDDANTLQRIEDWWQTRWENLTDKVQ